VGTSCRRCSSRDAFSASLIVCLLWGVWHLPTFSGPSDPTRPALSTLVLLTMAYTVALSWLYVHPGSVILAISCTVHLLIAVLTGTTDPIGRSARHVSGPRVAHPVTNRTWPVWVTP
jgi:Type II CAAX prenyl endopeptidase Rce1-like